MNKSIEDLQQRVKELERSQDVILMFLFFFIIAVAFGLIYKFEMM